MRSFLAILLVAACSSGGSDKPPSYDAGRTRRVIDPPSGVVRAVPPHAIDPGGVGPYRLGATQAEVFEALPPEQQIPRVAILDVERVLDASVVRAEEDTVLVGGRPGERMSFVAVLAPKIARADGGVGVGSTVKELATLGPEKDERAERDPRIVVPASLPGARFVVDGERVIAILLRKADDRPPAGCKATLPASEASIRAAAGLERGRVRAACLTSAGKEAVVTDGNAVVVVDADGSKARRVTTTELPGLVWAAPLHGDDRDEIVAIVERRDDDALTETLIVMRLEGGKLVRTLEEKVYELSATSAQWIGAKLDEVRLFLTVEGRGDGYEVGGILVHGNAETTRDVAPLVPRSVQRPKQQRRVPPPPATAPDAGAPRDATPPDAGVAPVP